MSEPDDYCELCDLPKSQCIHGRPPPPEPAAPRRTQPKARSRTSAPKQSSAVTTSKPIVRRWTPPELFQPIIVSVLQDSGHELQTDEVMAELENRVGDQLRPGDHERTPEGELRWHYAARRARQALVKEGQMLKAGPGVWKLAD